MNQLRLALEDIQFDISQLVEVERYRADKYVSLAKPWEIKKPAALSEVEPTVQHTIDEKKYTKDLADVDKLLQKARLIRESTDKSKYSSKPQSAPLCNQCVKGFCQKHKSSKQRNGTRSTSAKQNSSAPIKKAVKSSVGKNRQNAPLSGIIKSKEKPKQRPSSGDTGKHGVQESRGASQKKVDKSQSEEMKNAVGVLPQLTVDTAVEHVFTITLEDLVKESMPLTRYRKLMSMHTKVTTSKCFHHILDDLPSAEETNFIAKLKGKANNDSQVHMSTKAAHSHITKFNQRCENVKEILCTQQNILQNHNEAIRLHQDRLMCTYIGGTVEELDTLFQFITSAKIISSENDINLQPLLLSGGEHHTARTAFDELTFGAPKDLMKLAECHHEINWAKLLRAIRHKLHTEIISVLHDLGPLCADGKPSHDYIACIKTAYGLLAQKQGLSSQPAIIWDDSSDL